jgi:hypothetical protein
MSPSFPSPSTTSLRARSPATSSTVTPVTPPMSLTTLRPSPNSSSSSSSSLSAHPAQHSSSAGSLTPGCSTLARALASSSVPKSSDAPGRVTLARPAQPFGLRPVTLIGGFPPPPRHRHYSSLFSASRKTSPYGRGARTARSGSTVSPAATPARRRRDRPGPVPPDSRASLVSASSATAHPRSRRPPP